MVPGSRITSRVPSSEIQVFSTIFCAVFAVSDGTRWYPTVPERALDHFADVNSTRLRATGPRISDLLPPKRSDGIFGRTGLRARISLSLSIAGVSISINQSRRPSAHFLVIVPLRARQLLSMSYQPHLLIRQSPGLRSLVDILRHRSSNHLKCKVETWNIPPSSQRLGHVRRPCLPPPGLPHGPSRCR